ncbi:MAG: peptidoglycan DD-metalloendopeptidase family protein [Peptococcaceae bacterium]|nr:peptidoglycan DD-metalloendopeptidase family protein [Peptococcaceae bacterium]MDH7524860.1 peptidoglycan DD-metalloendopeptidase family protein [Peptococcaceae bacterium]
MKKCITIMSTRTGLACLGILLAAWGVSYACAVREDGPRALLADGSRIAVVVNESQVKEAVEKARAEMAQESGLTITGFKTVLSCEKDEGQPEGEPLAEKELVGLLKERLEWKVDAFAICVNGKSILCLADESSAREALERLKERYLSQEKEEYALDALGYAEEVNIKAEECLLKDIKTPEQAEEVLARGLDRMEQYIVKSGDTLWTIARDNNTTVEELREANPQINGDLLRIGQKIELKRLEPLLNVVYTLTTTVIEKTPYRVVYENDAGMYRHQQKVKQEGAYGSCRVTYRITKSNGLETARQVLAEEVLAEPVARVVVRGTRSMVVSSRSGNWQGQLEWPIQGPVTSGYGYRGREFHAAIDIDGVTGDPVYAAASGTVIFTGWAGNLGKCIAIDHDYGLVTRYAHLESINVSAGQKVSGGSLIGQVGSTGRSTGSHLHFEVWDNGQPQNPLRYLNK